MKKFISLGVVLLLVVGALYQNQGRFFLILLSHHQLSNPFDSRTGVSSIPSVAYKNGSFTGSVEDAFYGSVQVKTVIQSGKITDVQFLQYPQDAIRSQAINTFAMPNLTQEVISAQSANVAIISGATDTSQAFKASLQSALTKATK